MFDTPGLKVTGDIRAKFICVVSACWNDKLVHKSDSLKFKQVMKCCAVVQRKCDNFLFFCTKILWNVTKIAQKVLETWF